MTERAKRIKRAKPEGPCYVCGLTAFEWDHFPTPVRMLASDSPTAALPICRGCHDEKDRMGLDDYSPSVVFQALNGVWSKAERSERILMAKILTIVSDRLERAGGAQ